MAGQLEHQDKRRSAHEQVTAGALRSSLSDLLNRTAFGGERLVVTRHGKAIAAMITADDLELLERLEHAAEDHWMADAHATPLEPNVSAEDLHSELGL